MREDPQSKPRDLSRYDSSPGKAFKALGIVVVIGAILVLVLQFVFGVKLL